MTSILEVIQHYQRSIDSSQDNEPRLLHCINKLYKLPIKVEHLQETGVGKTVNSLRKFNGEIGVAAKALVTKWKAMVAAEEEPMDTTSNANETEEQNDTNGESDGGALYGNQEDENRNRNNTSQSIQQSSHPTKHNKDNHREKHTDRTSSRNNTDKYDSKQSKSKSADNQIYEKPKISSEKERSLISLKEKTHNSSSSRKEGENDKGSGEAKRYDKEKRRDDKHKNPIHKSEREHKEYSKKTDLKSSSHSRSSKSRHETESRKIPVEEKESSKKHKSSIKDEDSTSAKDKSSATSSTSKSSTKKSESSDRKRHHNDNDTTDFKSPQHKVAKTHKSSTSVSRVDASPLSTLVEKEATEDSFDSSMGTNFNDVLGMLNMPVKKIKKSLKSPSTPVNSSSSNKTERQSAARSSGSSVSSNVASKNSVKTTSTYNHSTPITMKPDLLASTAKLEPLDPSIALELPTISTNYKPMPLNQTVMDCVFNNFASTSKPMRTLTDAEAIIHGISSKTIRTKIYSGVRTGQTYQVSSLFDMCIRVLQKNIDALEYTGGVPFEVLKPVLERATPNQLYVFEEYNPYLMEDSDVLWQQHVSRSYRTKKRLENESWREMFLRCQEEEEQRLSVLKDSIKASQKIAAAPVRKTQLAFVDSMVKPPRNVLRKQEQFGTRAKLVATPAARVASLSSVTPNAARTGDQRLKISPNVRDHAQVASSSSRPKKAPLMQKTLQFIRGRYKR